MYITIGFNGSKWRLSSAQTMLHVRTLQGNGHGLLVKSSSDDI